MSNQEHAPPQGGLDRYFKITERGSTVGREVRGGLVTFFTMAYIIVLNPLDPRRRARHRRAHVLGGGADGLDLAMIAAGTALVAGITDDPDGRRRATTRWRWRPASA